MDGKGWKIIEESKWIKEYNSDPENITNGAKSKVGRHTKDFQKGDNTMVVRCVDDDGNWYYKAECADDEDTLASFLNYCSADVGATALQEYKEEKGKKVWVTFFE